MSDMDLTMEVFDEFAKIGGFLFFCMNTFRFGATYINKWLFINDVMQLRYQMHKNVDIDHSEDPRGRYQAQFDEMKAEDKKAAE